MALFEGASEFIIHGSQFNNFAGIYSPGSKEESIQMVRKLVEKDSSLNQYSVEHGTVTLPYFPKALLLQDLQVDPDAGRISAGSSSFDLLVRLGLFPGQQNEALAKYDTGVPLDAVVGRGNCYCGRISRHGLVFLVSKYFQHASMEETAKGGTCFILSTSIGRFKCYEIDDRIFVHFDSGSRSSSVDLVMDQNLDDILRASRGENRIAGVAPSHHIDNEFVWCRDTGEPIEKTFSVQYYGTPNAVVYMTRPTLQRWRRLKEFGYTVVHTVLSVLEGVTEPAEFVSALRNLPPLREGGTYQWDTVPTRSTPAEKLASCIFFYRMFSGRNVGLVEEAFNEFNTYLDMSLHDMLEAHRYFRSPRVELLRLMTTSHDRFINMLDSFQTVDDFNGAGRLSNDHIQRDLQTLLHTNRNNVALVVFQGFFALLSQYNASRILLRAREAPAEWIRFVGADDDMLFIG